MDARFSLDEEEGGRHGDVTLSLTGGTHLLVTARKIKLARAGRLVCWAAVGLFWLARKQEERRVLAGLGLPIFFLTKTFSSFSKQQNKHKF